MRILQFLFDVSDAELDIASTIGRKRARVLSGLALMIIGAVLLVNHDEGVMAVAFGLAFVGVGVAQVAARKR